jgi:hypothetical protein
MLSEILKLLNTDYSMEIKYDKDMDALSIAIETRNEPTWIRRSYISRTDIDCLKVTDDLLLKTVRNSVKELETFVESEKEKFKVYKESEKE